MIWIALAIVIWIVALPILFWVIDGILIGKNGCSRW
jgi:hypothetical protein